MSILRLLAAALLIALTATSAFAAPPKLDYLFPAGASRGETTMVTAAGTFANWPVETWVDAAGLKIEPAKEKGKLSITVDSDARPGVRFLRLVDREGGSALRPFYLGTLPEVLEQEDNDQPDAPQRLSASCTVNGQLRKRDDVDTYAIEVKQGQTLVASLRANSQLGSPVDAVLQVCSSEGFVLLQNDDEHGLDPQIAIEAPSDGTYLIRAFGFPAVPTSSISFAGGEDFVYRLTITTGPFVDHAMPLAAARNDDTTVRLFGWNLTEDLETIAIPKGDGDSIVVDHPQWANTLELPRVEEKLIVADGKASPASPQPIELPCVVSGRLPQLRQAHAFLFRARKGERLSFVVESAALEYPLDALLSVSDESGKVVSEVDDVGGANDAAITFTAPSDGSYTLLLRDLHVRGGFRFAYRLVCGPVEPDYSLSIAAGEFVAAAGKTLEVPITVNRQNGFNAEIAISANDLPKGVTCEPVTSAPKGDSAKTVKLKLTAASEAGQVSGAFRIVGRAGDSPAKTATFPLANIPGGQHSAAWLTVAEK
jgi:hypothetical protein